MSGNHETETDLDSQEIALHLWNLSLLIRDMLSSEPFFMR
jgi:hypothetical protein